MCVCAFPTLTDRASSIPSCIRGYQSGTRSAGFFFFFFFHLTHLQPMDFIITILPVVTKDPPISPRFTRYDFLSRCKFSTLTTRQPMVEFYLLTFPRFPLRKNTNPTLVRRQENIRGTSAKLQREHKNEKQDKNDKKRGEKTQKTLPFKYTLGSMQRYAGNP